MYIVKWVEMGPNGVKWIEMDRNGSKKGLKWMETNQNDLNTSKYGLKYVNIIIKGHFRFGTQT